MAASTTVVPAALSCPAQQLEGESRGKGTENSLEVVTQLFSSAVFEKMLSYLAMEKERKGMELIP